MRYSALLLILPLTAACEDALGPAGGCAREMRDARQQYGHEFTRSEGSDGEVFRETWLYPPKGSDPGRTVTFRWGTGMPCQVSEGPVSALHPTGFIIR